MNVRMLSQVVKFATRTRIDVNIIIFENMLIVSPTTEILKIVATHDKRKALVGILLSKMCESDNSIRRYRKMKFGVTGSQHEVVINGNTNHQ